MKYAQHTGLSRPAPALKSILSGLALAACLGFAVNSQAQNCTISNWTGALNLTDDDAGTQGANNRRYAGPCGLRVPLNGTASFLTDDSPVPSGEPSYIARFYVFLDDAGVSPVILFAADDGDEDQVQVWYNFPSEGDLNLRVFDQAGEAADLTVDAENVGSGWKAIEFQWEASAASDNVVFSVSDRFGNAEGSATVDTTGLVITSAHLGVLNDVTGGSVDFDDFDSRRINRPGRVCRGLTDENRNSLIADDGVAIFQEAFAIQLAPGTPDYDEDGSITADDAIGVFQTVFGVPGGAPSTNCADNS